MHHDFLRQLNHERRIRHAISMPFIYPLILPVLLLDICLEIFHHICFPLYGLDLVDRSKYVKIDRHKLEYLKPMQKVNCAYCGYVNGVLAYWVKIAGETE